MLKGPIWTPSDCDTSTSTKPSGSNMTNGVPGLPARSAHPSGVDEVTFVSTPGGQPDTSGKTIAPVKPPMRNF